MLKRNLMRFAGPAGWLRDQEPLSRRTFLKGVGLAGTGFAAASLVGCESATGPDGPPRGELVLLQSFSPHVRVFDPVTNQLLRQADIPNFLRWSWNDDNNYYDGRNLWLGAMTPAHGQPDFEGNEVILLNLDTLSVTARIPLGKEGTMANPNTGVSNAMLNIGKPTRDGRILVGKMFMGEVAAIDVRTRSVVTSKKLLDGADWVCDSDFSIASDGQPRLFVATNNTGKVLSVDPRTLAVITTYQAPAGVRPYMLTAAPDGDRIWVQNAFAATYIGERFGLTVFDARTLAVIKQFNTGLVPMMNTFSPDGKLAYVGHANGPYVTVIDTTTLAEVRRIAASANAASLAVHPDGKSIVIKVSGSANYLVPVDTSTWQLGARFAETAAAAQSGLFMRRLT